MVAGHTFLSCSILALFLGHLNVFSVRTTLLHRPSTQLHFDVSVGVSIPAFSYRKAPFGIAVRSGTKQGWGNRQWTATWTPEFHTVLRALVASKWAVWPYVEMFIAIRALLVKLCLQNSLARSGGKQCEKTRTPFCVRNVLVGHMLNVSKCEEVFFIIT